MFEKVPAARRGCSPALLQAVTTTGTPPIEDPTGVLPELYFGAVSAVGLSLEFTFKRLVHALERRSYKPILVRLSDLPALLKVPTPEPAAGSREFDRVWALMDRGNEAREISGMPDILVRLAMGIVSEERTKRQDGRVGFAALFRQLKHPEEVYRLRQVYEDGFHLVGIYSPRSVRIRRLQIEKGMTKEEATRLIARDEYEDEKHGQRVRNTFHLSDVFVRATGEDSDLDDIDSQLSRFFDLLFGDDIHTPTRDEYGMFLAWSSGLRSAQLARQVGAAILSSNGEVLSLGTNEVPCGGGGQYWEGENGDGRDHAYPQQDPTDKMKRKMLWEILQQIEPTWKNLSDEEREVLFARRKRELSDTRLMNLTEFTRAVHAEMEALLSAARVGISVRGATLYTTTFPCHNCAKHIVDAGIARVVFIEPYPKSLAIELHNDSIALDGETDAPAESVFEQRIPFEPFIGIAPRRYADLFSMTTPDGRAIRRKDENGRISPGAPGLRLKLRRDSFIDREAKVIKMGLDQVQKGGKTL